MTLDIAALGYGFIGTAHANALARLPMFFPEAPEVNLDTMIDISEEALAEAETRLDFDRYVTDWRDVIDDVDVFYNLGPNNVHPQPSIAALENDVHVFCEKPLAHTLEAAEDMAAAAAESDATAGIAFNYRFIPAIQHAQNLIASGELGEIHHVRARYLQDWLVDSDAVWTWRNSEEIAGTGSLGDLGAHSIDLAQFLIGEDIERVSGHTKIFVDERPVPDSDEYRDVTVDDAYTAQAEFGSGAMATLEASRFARGHANENIIEINGSKGSLKFNLERLNELELLREDDRGYETIMVTDPEDPYIDHWWPPGHIIGWEHTFVHENFEFLRSASVGEDHDPSFQTALQVQRVLDAIQRADDTGEWVTV